jgi:hypothetical protein
MTAWGSDNLMRLAALASLGVAGERLWSIVFLSHDDDAVDRWDNGAESMADLMNFNVDATAKEGWAAVIGRRRVTLGGAAPFARGRQRARRARMGEERGREALGPKLEAPQKSGGNGRVQPTVTETAAAIGTARLRRRAWG